MASEKTFELNRSKIVGEITENTPICVIIEIAQSAGFDIDICQCNDPRYIKTVIHSLPLGRKDIITESKYQSPEIHGFKLDQLQKIALFISNIKTTWKTIPLINSFRHLVLYYENAELPENGFIIGQKSMDFPLAYNACMLYKICKFHQIKTNRQTSIETMGQAVKYLIQDPDKLRQKMIHLISSVPYNELICLSMKSNLKLAPTPNLKYSKNTNIICTDIEPLSSIKIRNINFKNLDISLLNQAYENITNITSTLIRLDPISQEEAIMLAAVIFGINLTECCNPYNEYLEMKLDSIDGSAENRYIPVHDQNFRKRYLINPEWYNVKKTWTPILPKIYDLEGLKILTIAEGYSPENVNTSDIDNLMQMMYESRTVPNFYLGKHPDCKDLVTTIDRDEISTVNPKLLISYGIEIDKTLNVYKISELSKCFLQYKCYVNPLKTSEIIPEKAIQKLKQISLEYVNKKIIENNPIRQRPISIIQRIARLSGTSSQSNVNTNENIFEEFNRMLPGKLINMSSIVEFEYTELLEVIKIIEKYNKNISVEARRLIQGFQTSDNNVKEKILFCLNNLLEFGMYMRGWKINGQIEYPLTRDQTVQGSGDYSDQINFNSTNALNEYLKSLEFLPAEIADIFNKLPLMIAKNSSVNSDITLEVCCDINQGLTIFDRIQIVREGDEEVRNKSGKQENVYSCIRMSSNNFLWSSYYYLTLLNQPAPFNLKDLYKIT